MRFLHIRRWCVAVCMAVTLVLGSGPGLANAAWAYWSYGDGTDVPISGSWTPYSTPRYVKWAPYGIWFQKYDGPAMSAKWVHCNTTSGGSAVGVSNADPAPGVFLKPNGSGPSYLQFCLAFKNNNNNADTFTGALNWDGDYAP